MIGKYGPVIKCVKEGKTTFKQVKKNIDMDVLKAGDYSIEDIVDNSSSTKGTNINLGSYNDNVITVKKGKYGYYINHKNSNYSLKSLQLNENNLSDFTFEKAVEIIKDGGIKLRGGRTDGVGGSGSGAIKIINENASVRKGKYGPYVFYKTESMNKPVFLPLKKTNIEDVNEEWIANALTKKFNR